MFVCNGILLTMNHQDVVRLCNRKITMATAAIAKGNKIVCT
jgi:hypothetical protein